MGRLDELSREDLIGIILELKTQVDGLTERVVQLESENAELRSGLGGGGSVTASKPDWVKPNRSERRGAERAKRKSSFARKRDIPTEVVEHAVENCPDCGRSLVGGWVHSRRQVIELPQTPVRVIEHVLIGRWCGVCGKRHVPKLDLSDQVLGNCRLGVRLMSVIADMATSCRMPHRTIQRLLGALYGLRISLGEISEVLHKVAERGKEAYDEMLWEIRGSPVVNADETGWREDGVNGYIWSFSNPEVRYLLRDQSRASRVVTETLGDEFDGVLVSDFYGAYNAYGGVKQRCWVHLLRDLKKLVEKHPGNESVARWTGRVKRIYEQAREASTGNYIPTERCRLRRSFETRLLKLAQPYRDAKTAPQRVLAKRIESFLGELFTFVEHDGVPADNNAAERSVRPAVIARKVSGGTRSSKGSNTRMTLFSLFGTWNVQGKETISACTDLLTQPV
jgi:hypothetical protein